jgi:4-amino-4-deoxy-L-arabinose transferase-like glycosyltransferase
MEELAPQPAMNQPARFWREPQLWLLVLLAAGTYLARLDVLPIRGEEPRRARVAYEMLATGDWIVPRQQGSIYLSRPPLGNWLIAATGYLRGEIDPFAVRLPSALATVLTSILIYAYCRTWLGRLGAFAAGIAFVTTAMVIELGRLGESEAVFTCFVSSSLLLWHWGYQRGWPAAATWCLGYVLAALAGLTKGPQGPVYFAAPVMVFLMARRDWRYLFSRWHVCGIVAFAAALAVWQVPFALSTDWQSVRGIWLANAAERFADDRPTALVRHLLAYPVELFCCLLPWSLPLLYLTNRRFWRSLSDLRPWILFSLVAIGVCLPSVWFASGAKGRYFMPLFPCFAVLLGIVAERCWQLTPAEAPRRAWNQFLAALAAVAAGAGVCILAASCVPRGPLVQAAQSPLFAAVYGLAALAAAYCLLAARREGGARFAIASLTSLALLLACTTVGVATNIRFAQSEDTAGAIARLKQQLPPQARLVSLGGISHVFAYYYGGLMPSVPWPSETQALSPDVEYFCFNKLESESFEFPFAWEPVAVISLDRVRRAVPERTVVVGRRIDGRRLASAED